MEVNAVLDSERYWTLLERTLREVYGKAPHEAAEMVAGLKAEMTFKVSDEERLLFFHNEPLAVAQDLTRGSQPPKNPSEEIVLKYQAIAHALGWRRTEGSQLSRTLPR